MRAIAMTDYDSGVALLELPTPLPAPNELLVRVQASSVNRIDVLVAGGGLRGMMEYEFPAVPGRDFAGTVEQLGAGVGRFAVGDDVFRFLTKPTVHEGAWADYVTVGEDGFVARKPSGLDFTQAAALPLAGVTALVAVDAVDPHEADTVLVVGADGGVGGYAMQFAARRRGVGRDRAVHGWQARQDRHLSRRWALIRQVPAPPASHRDAPAVGTFCLAGDASCTSPESGSRAAAWIGWRS